MSKREEEKNIGVDFSQAWVAKWALQQETCPHQAWAPVRLTPEQRAKAQAIVAAARI